MRKSLLMLSLAPLLLVACKPIAYTAPTAAADAAAASTAPATDTANARPPRGEPGSGDVGAASIAADDNLNAVLWVQASAEYGAATQTVYNAATRELDAALKAPDHDALVPGERGNAVTGLPPAVVMDVDETVLDNSPYQARLIADNQEYDEVTWAAWVAEKRARAVPGVVAFAKAANDKGITILYLSNRAEHLKDATLANLRSAGLPVKDDSVFLGLGIFVKDCEQNGSEKNCRRQLAGQRYRVLMQFGDQLGDFVQVVANTPAARAELATKYAGWFGERWWMLPNPTYGSWEPALFNNAFDQPREARRTAKHEALDVAR